MSAVVLDQVEFTYPGRAAPVLADLTLAVEPGESLAIVGAGGSGRSTLARLLGGLLAPTHGTITFGGTHRQQVGAALVFQNPENQLVGMTVEEDIAFGPGNLQVPPAEIARRVDEALELCGLMKLRWRSVSTLSGGEKQRVALAGAVAMHPVCLVLDEATAMLDAPAKEALWISLSRIRAYYGMAVVHIPHALEEAVHAGRVAVLQGGRIVAEGPPWELLSDADRLGETGLEVPALYRIAACLPRRLLAGVRTPKELAAAICRYASLK